MLAFHLNFYDKAFYIYISLISNDITKCAISSLWDRKEDLFLTEGMAFTKSIGAVREELTEIKDQCFMNYIPTDQDILCDPIQTMSNETTSVPTCFESNEGSEFSLSNHHLQQNIYSENSLLCKKISSSISDGDDTSDIFEDPMSFPEFVRIYLSYLFRN